MALAREGGPVKTEDDPLDRHPPPLFRLTLEAIRHLESAVTGETALEGVVLRYGSFYGPGTAISGTGWMVDDIHKRRVPIIGGGGGIWSFIRVEDAARLTLAAIEHGAPGVYNIVDDDPAPVSEWLPFLVGAKPPHRIPAWIVRFLIGDAVMFMTEVRGASNQKAKQALEVNLKWPSWREGFRGGLAGPLPPGKELVLDAPSASHPIAANSGVASVLSRPIMSLVKQPRHSSAIEAARERV